jgi:hypothetical protein
MNQPHYAKAYDISEVMGKFDIVRFKPLTKAEVLGILNSRLKLVSENLDCSAVFEDETINLILEYTNGVPRNVLTICGKLWDATPENQKITSAFAKPFLIEIYADAIIEDRSHDPSTLPIYKDIIKILDQQPTKAIESKEKLTQEIIRLSGRGRCICIKYINDLIKWGLINEQRGGTKRTNKILTLTFKNGGGIE